MICPRCNKNLATVHVTEVTEFIGPEHPDNQVQDHFICQVCAQELDVSVAGMAPKAVASQIWKLLQLHTKKGQIRIKTGGPSCPSCGMTLEELQRHGRVGCARCYEAFQEHLDQHLERLHGSKEHVGRLPGISEGELARRQRVSDLRGALELAVREEDYERAATLRDELAALETEVE